MNIRKKFLRALAFVKKSCRSIAKFTVQIIVQTNNEHSFKSKSGRLIVVQRSSKFKSLRPQLLFKKGGMIDFRPSIFNQERSTPFISFSRGYTSLKPCITPLSEESNIKLNPF